MRRYVIETNEGKVRKAVPSSWSELTYPVWKRISALDDNFDDDADRLLYAAKVVSILLDMDLATVLTAPHEFVANVYADAADWINDSPVSIVEPWTLDGETYEAPPGQRDHLTTGDFVNANVLIQTFGDSASVEDIGLAVAAIYARPGDRDENSIVDRFELFKQKCPMDVVMSYAFFLTTFKGAYETHTQIYSSLQRWARRMLHSYVTWGGSPRSTWPPGRACSSILTETQPL